MFMLDIIVIFHKKLFVTYYYFILILGQKAEEWYSLFYNNFYQND